jgi:hypothetical protein
MGSLELAGGAMYGVGLFVYRRGGRGVCVVAGCWFQVAVVVVGIWRRAWDGMRKKGESRLDSVIRDE